MYLTGDLEISYDIYTNRCYSSGKLSDSEKLATCQYIMCFDLVANTEYESTSIYILRKESTYHVRYMYASAHYKPQCPVSGCQIVP